MQRRNFTIFGNDFPGTVLKIKTIFLLVAAITLSSFVIAQNVYTLGHTEKPVRIGNRFLYFRDATKKMNIDEVLKGGKFEPNTDEVPNYDVTSDVIWGEIKFTCKENADWYLSFEQPFDRVTFYQRRGNGPWLEAHVGNLLPAEQSVHGGRQDVKLNVEQGDTTLFLFSASGVEPFQFDINTGTLNSFVVPTRNTDLFNGLCFGVMLMMLIYNWYLYVTQKQRIYFYYVLYVFCNGIFLATFSGYFFYLPAAIRSTILFDRVLFPAAFGVFLLLFTIDLFKEYIKKRQMQIIYIFMAVIIADAVLGVTPYKMLAFNILRGLGLLLGVICLRAGFGALSLRSSAAKFYILGFGAYLSGLAFLILSGHIIPANSIAIMVIVTGSMLECVFLSFAQADKLKVFQREKEKAQQETIVQVQKNEQLVREQNVVLEQKVKERTAELAEKNKEITDSIQYAKRIQSTLLAHEDLLKQNIPQHFILFKPKDIVSGDFYWATQKDNKFYLAVCDSTGHGVPGAFMSLLNISFLNEAVNEKDIENPGEVFNYVRSHLINSISRDGGRDGMDGVLICFEKNGQSVTMKYAAANNDLLVARNNQLIELEADKMPVGQGEKMDSFTARETVLQKGDILYLFTDGYADQFGGPRGKKYKYKQLLESLSGISNKPLAEQKNILDETFETWKGNLEQVDDVLVIGIQV